MDNLEFELISNTNALSGGYRHGLYYVISDNIEELKKQGLWIDYKSKASYILIALEAIENTSRHIRIDKLYDYNTDAKHFSPYHLTRTTNKNGIESKERGYFYLSRELEKTPILQKISYYYDRHTENKATVAASIHTDVITLGVPLIQRLLAFRNKCM